MCDYAKVTVAIVVCVSSSQVVNEQLAIVIVLLPVSHPIQCRDLLAASVVNGVCVCESILGVTLLGIEVMESNIKILKLVE